MKKLFLCLLLALTMAISAAALEVPTDRISTAASSSSRPTSCPRTRTRRN